MLIAAWVLIIVTGNSPQTFEVQHSVGISFKTYEDCKAEKLRVMNELHPTLVMCVRVPKG